jgi:hypothetical protein
MRRDGCVELDAPSDALLAVEVGEDQSGPLAFQLFTSPA